MAAVFERHTVLSTSGTYKTGNDGGGGGGKKRVEADFEKKKEKRRRQGELTVRLLWCGKQWAKTLKAGGRGAGARGVVGGGVYYGMAVFVRLGGGGVR